MTNQITLQLSDEKITFHYDQLLEGNIYYTSTPSLIKKNFKNFDLSNPFPNNNTRYSKREENVFIAYLFNDGEVYQLLITKDSNEDLYKNHKNKEAKYLYNSILKFAFELREIETLGQAFAIIDEDKEQ